MEDMTIDKLRDIYTEEMGKFDEYLSEYEQTGEPNKAITKTQYVIKNLEESYSLEKLVSIYGKDAIIKPITMYVSSIVCRSVMTVRYGITEILTEEEMVMKARAAVIEYVAEQIFYSALYSHKIDCVILNAYMNETITLDQMVNMLTTECEV